MAPRHESEFEASVESLLDAIPAFVWFKDRNNRIIHCNEAAAASMGTTPAEIEGHDTREFYPDEASAYYEDDLEVIRSGQAKRGIVEPLQTAAGDKIWIRTDKIPVRDDSGEVVGLIVFAIDITDLKDAEQARLDLEQRLQQAQRMEALGRLAGGVAHDLNNYLTPILGLSEIAAAAPLGSDDLVRDLRDIHGAAERASALVRQLLHLGRRQVRSPRRLDLAATLERLEPILRRIMPASVRCEFRLADVDGVVVADPAEIEIVAMNLAANARDAIVGSAGKGGGGGEVRVETEAREVPVVGAPDAAGIPAGSWAVLRFTDSGAGMDEATRSRMFEPFFTTRRPGHGTGLGLSTVDAIVRQNAGHIVVASEPGQGTRIEVYLPRIEGEPDPDEPEPGGAPVASHQTVLVVEDEAEVRSLIERMLTRQGYRVVAVASAGEAERIVGTPDLEIDLLLCDVVLEDESGLELAERLLRRRPGLPVLWTSGHAADVVEAHGVTGPMDLLSKPFSSSELYERVRAAIERGRVSRS